MLVPLAACPTGGELPDGGGMASCGGSSGTSTLATWTNIRDLVDIKCAGSDCHESREPIMIGSPVALTDAQLYTKLTTYVAPQCGNRKLVKPCDPNESAFVRAQAGMCEGLPGTVLGMPLPYMPFGCDPMYDNCTPADVLDGVRQWIANGAPRP